MPSFKWDDASDRLMLLAYLETNNSLPRDYEPLALVLGPQVSTKMVHARLQRLLGEAAAIRQVATNFSHNSSNNKGRKRPRETGASDTDSEEVEQGSQKSNKKKTPRPSETEVEAPLGAGTQGCTRRKSDAAGNPSDPPITSRHFEARKTGQNDGRQGRRSAEETNTQSSTSGKKGRQDDMEPVDQGGQQAISQANTLTSLGARTKPTSYRSDTGRRTLANDASKELSHATEDHLRLTQTVPVMAPANVETGNPRPQTESSHLSHPATTNSSNFPLNVLGQSRTLDRDQGNTGRARQHTAEQGWKLTSGGEVISDGVSEGVVSSSSSAVKEESDYSDNKGVGDDSDDDSDLVSEKEEEVDDSIKSSPEGVVGTKMQLRSATIQKKAPPRLAWGKFTCKGTARIITLPKIICQRLSQWKLEGARRIQRETGAERITVHGHKEGAKVNETWAEVKGSYEAAQKVLMVFQAMVDDPNIPMNDALATLKKTK